MTRPEVTAIQKIHENLNTYFFHFVSGQEENPTFQSILKDLAFATDSLYEVRKKIEKYYSSEWIKWVMAEVFLTTLVITVAFH